VNVQFAKMHGLGNDFMVLDRISQPFQPKPEQIQAWSDRHTGIGFDQLLIVAPPDDPDVDFRYQIFNADGTEAEHCGNGARCVAKLVADKGLSVKTTIRFQTRNGRFETTLLSNDQVEVDMGAPGLEAATIPCDPSEAALEEALGDAIRYVLTDAAGGQHPLTVASMGNPHGVILVNDISSAPVDEIGGALTSHPFFPERANIGFCQVVDRGFIRLRVFERGVGETRACGTGACAAAVTSRLAGMVDEQVKVSLPGGKVRIRWQGPDHAVKMTGPATLVYEGQLAVEDL
jgi:diaminopimelate epimerase